MRIKGYVEVAVTSDAQSRPTTIRAESIVRWWPAEDGGTLLLVGSNVEPLRVVEPYRLVQDYMAEALGESTIDVARRLMREAEKWDVEAEHDRETRERRK